LIFLLDDESGTATEDEEDIRARELRKQEVWLKVPPRSSDTDTGSETEVKHFQDSIDSTVAQESLISFESKVIVPSESNMNANANESLSDRNNLEESLKSSDEVALTSSELALSIHNQDAMTSADKNGTSLNVAPQTSKSVICVTNSLSPIPADADDSISNSNRSLICFTNIPDNNYLDKENCSSEYESFVDENVQLDLNNSDNKIDSNSLQNDVNVDTRNFNSNPIDLSINVNDSNSNDLIKNSLDFSINNLEKDFVAQNEEAGLEQVARITLADTTPCTEVSKDPKVSDNETILNVGDLPDVIASSLNTNKNCPSSLSSEICQSIEISNNNSASSNCLDNLVEYSKSDLLEETGIHKHEDICVINQSEDNNSTDKNKNIIVDDKNIHMSDIADKEINVNEIIPKIAANIVQKSVYPTVTVTSPSPTQEIQLEELSLETSKLLVPLESHNIPDRDNAFDKLKRDLQQRKARNKAVGNELRPLSIESARLKMSKYFIENKKVISKRQSARNEATEDTSEIEMVKLDIKPRLSGRINTEEMLKYFDKTNSSSSCDKYKVSNTTGIAIKQNEHQKLKIDIEDVNDKTIDQQFNQIEAQNEITDMEDNGMDSQSHLPAFEICNDKKETAFDNLDLMYDDLVELQPHLNDIEIDYVDPLTSDHNVPKLEDYNTEVSYLDIDLETVLLIDVENNQSENNQSITNIEKTEKNNSINNILKNDINSIHKEKEVNLNLSSSLIDNDTINDILLTDVENNQSDFMNDIEKTEKTNSINNILKNDVNNIQGEKEVNVNLSSLIDNDTINKDNVINIDPESNTLNSGANEERKENSIYLDKIVLDDNNKKIANKIDILDKDKDLNKKLFENNTHINTLSIVPLLNNNTDKVIKHNMIHKSDTNLNDSTPQFFNKNIKTNSKSLPVLKDTIYEDVFAAKVTIVDKVMDAAAHAIDTKIANDNSIQNCIREVPNRLEQKNLSIGHLSQNDATTTPNLFTIAHTELSPPEIPVRKKSVKRSLKPLYQSQDVENISKQSQITPEIPARKKAAKKSLKSLSQNQDVEDILKLQDQTVNNISKLCENSKFNQNDNDVSNFQNQITEEFSEIKTKGIKDVTLPCQSISNISKINQDISTIQNHDIKSVQKPLRLNVKKLQNEDITDFSNLHNEIKKDSVNITTAENRNIADIKLQNQSKNIPSIQKTHSTNRLSNKSEEYTKSVSHSSNSKKDKCVIS